MSLVLERKASKDEILELYLNDVYLGQRGSFAIHGVAEASRIFFGKDVANVSISEAAVIAGVIQSPASRSPFANPKRSIERRNVVLRAMAEEGFITEDEATRAMREPLVVAARGVDNEAPYFVDMIGQQVAELFPRVLAESPSVDVYTTLDLSLQRAALDAMRSGLARVDKQLAGRRSSRGRIAQSALIAVDPQDRRDPRARRRPLLQPVAVQPRDDQPAPAGLGVQAVRVPRRLRLRGARGPHRPDAGLARRSTSPRPSTPTPASCGSRRTTAANTRARSPGAAPWRCRATSAPSTSAKRWASTRWRRSGAGSAWAQPPRGFPSITLGVFELTPFEVATAYTLFTNGGAVRPLRGIERVEAGGKTLAAAGGAAQAGDPPRHHLSRHQHDAQRAQRGHRRRRAIGRASSTTPRARPARPTICATPGSSASRPSS